MVGRHFRPADRPVEAFGDKLETIARLGQPLRNVEILAEFAAAGEGALEFFRYETFAGGLAMQLEADIFEPDFAEAVSHDIERRHFLRDEKDFLSIVSGAGDDIGDRLRFACAGRPLNDEVAPCPRRFDHLDLRRIGVEDVVKIGRPQDLIELGGIERQRRFAAEALAEQSAQQRMAQKRVLRPIRGFEVAHHHQP